MKPDPAPSTTPEAEPDTTTSFEDAVKRLAEVVEKLERSDLPLEESLRLFEEGVKLARVSQARLDAAERRVEQLLGIDSEGQPVVRQIPEPRDAGAS